jgi:hypothetical protein
MAAFVVSLTSTPSHILGNKTNCFIYLHILMKLRSFIISFFLLHTIHLSAQQLGGTTVFNFTNQPNSSQLAALGGVNISNISNDVSMSFHSPSLLRTQMHQQLNASFNNYFAGVKNYSITSDFYLPKPNTNLAIGINYFDYGTLTQTDAAGNILGNFHPNDYVLQLTASHKYLTHWWYGMTVKFISSNYGQYKSNGIAADVGVSYYDSANFLQASFLVKNMGTQLKTYSSGLQKEQVPFDMQIGITKRLEHAPFQFSLTAHHLQAFNIYYNDTAYNASIGNDNTSNNFTLNKIVSHLVLATQVFITDQLEVSAGYNFLRRHDLTVYNTTNGLSGFTLGLGIMLKRLHIRYATGFYQQNMFHQIGVNLNWKGEMIN